MPIDFDKKIKSKKSRQSRNRIKSKTIKFRPISFHPEEQSGGMNGRRMRMPVREREPPTRTTQVKYDPKPETLHLVLKRQPVSYW